MFMNSTLLRLQYSLFDICISIFCIGLFSPSWILQIAPINSYVLFSEPYCWFTSPFDYVVLSIVRLLLIIIGDSLLNSRDSKTMESLRSPIALICLLSYSYSLVKLLVLSENEALTSFPGLWICPLWNTISNIITYFMWSKMAEENSELTKTSSIKSDTPTPSTKESTENSKDSTEDDEKSYELRMNTLQHMWLLVKICMDEWIWYTIGWTFLFLYTSLDIYKPSLTGQVINDVVLGRGFDALIRSVITMGAVTAASLLFDGIRSGAFYYASGRLQREVKSKLFRTLVNQEIAFYDTTKSGDMHSRLVNDTHAIYAFVARDLTHFISSALLLIGTLCFIISYSWRLTMVTFIGMPPIFYIVKIYGDYFEVLSEKIQDTTAKSNQVALEVLSTIRTVRSFASERIVAEKYDENLDTTLKETILRSRATVGFAVVNQLYDNAIIICVLLYGGHLVFTNKMSGEHLVSFILYQKEITKYLYRIFYDFIGVKETLGSSRKVVKLMMRQTEIPNDGSLKPSINGEIKLTDVCFTYPTRPNNAVLQDINLTIEAGSTVALVGPSGGGKSSIVSLIQHFYEPSRGSITLDGIPIKDISHEYYHQMIALVAQEPVLYSGSVRDNIMYGCEWATEEDMMSAARMANVDEFVSKLDKGYDTECGEKGIQMSGGQKQRIAIARALVRRPSVLILDEATSALDAESEALVQEAINNCTNERTVLIIAHRLSTIEKADKIAVIQDGSVIQLGSHQELMRKEDGLYRSLVSKQMLQPMKQD